MSLNQELIRSRCQEISDSLHRLQKIADQPVEQFLQDRDLQDIACYRLLVAIEAALALCYHVAAHKLQKVPEEYAECFAILADENIIEAELGERLQKMARFRNLLVHMYFKVDYSRVYEITKEHINDLRSFCSAITKLL